MSPARGGGEGGGGGGGGHASPGAPEYYNFKIIFRFKLGFNSDNSIR